MSITKAALLASSPLLTSDLTLIELPSSEAAKKVPEAGGWDPYEVWRTRVLLPRLNEKTAADELSNPLPLA